MELSIGDLVRHNRHGFYGIVVSDIGYWGNTTVVKVEWCESGLNHLVDTFFLDKMNKP